MADVVAMCGACDERPVLPTSQGGDGFGCHQCIASHRSEMEEQKLAAPPVDTEAAEVWRGLGKMERIVLLACAAVDEENRKQAEARPAYVRRAYFAYRSEKRTARLLRARGLLAEASCFNGTGADIYLSDDLGKRVAAYGRAVEGAASTESELTRRAREVLAGLSAKQCMRVDRLHDSPVGGLRWGHAAAENNKLRALGIVSCNYVHASRCKYAVLTDLGRECARLRSEGDSNHGT